MTAYADLADLPEDDRIDVIGKMASAGQIVAFIVDDNEKADRYLNKLRAKFTISVIARGVGPVKNTVFVKIGPLLN